MKIEKFNIANNLLDQIDEVDAAQRLYDNMNQRPNDDDFNDLLTLVKEILPVAKSKHQSDFDNL